MIQNWTKCENEINYTYLCNKTSFPFRETEKPMAAVSDRDKGVFQNLNGMGNEDFGA